MYISEKIKIIFEPEYEKLFPLTKIMWIENNYLDPLIYFYYNKKILSGIAIYEIFDNDYCHLWSFEIATNLRKQHLGTDFMNCLKSKFSTIYLFCTPGVENFYKKCGFIADNIENGYFYWIFLKG